MRFILPLTTVLSLLLVPAAWAQTLKIAAIDWCPQICPNQNNPGYVIDIVKAAFTDSDYQLQIRYYPWSRAIRLAQQGKVDALLSPAKAEAPSLRYPTHEIGLQRMCFFTLKQSSWHYNGPNSLKGMQIGIATDTSIEELNQYVLRNPDQFQARPYQQSYVSQSANKLDKRRIDTFLFTHNTTVYELKKHKRWHQYRLAGCVTSAPIYMAFTAKASGARISTLINLFDQRMDTLHKQGTVTRIMQTYGLLSWRK